jgi:hypothetical protein
MKRDLSEGETIVEAQGLTIKEEDNSIAFQVTALSGNTYSCKSFWIAKQAGG